MHSKSLRYPGCKWSKHVALLEKPALHSYLPKTDLFSKESFIKYVNRFTVVFLKPSLGGGGKGVYKISREGRNFILHSSIYKKIYTSKSRLFFELKRRCSKRKYIIQQGLDLMRIGQRVVDFRIVLFKPRHTWEFVGIMGKCAAKNKFVTNHARGGKSIRLKQALKLGLNYTDKECEELEEKLQTLGFNIAHALNESYYNITELGLDIALDSNEKLWLLEANTKPQFNLFKDHDDKTLFNKILKHTKQLRSLS